MAEYKDVAAIKTKIQKICDNCWHPYRLGGCPEHCGINDALKAIDSVPPAQPGWITDVNDILVYLNGVVHPLVSPENWNVYSELYDMVSGLLNPWEGGQDGD